jgi:hypothetical protein
MRHMEKIPKSLKALAQNDFREHLETWQACVEWCVASNGFLSHFSGRTFKAWRYHGLSVWFPSTGQQYDIGIIPGN